jgi:hypothetical protein
LFFVLDGPVPGRGAAPTSRVCGGVLKGVRREIRGERGEASLRNEQPPTPTAASTYYQGITAVIVTASRANSASARSADGPHMPSEC